MAFPSNTSSLWRLALLILFLIDALCTYSCYGLKESSSDNGILSGQQEESSSTTSFTYDIYAHPEGKNHTVCGGSKSSPCSLHSAIDNAPLYSRIVLLPGVYHDACDLHITKPLSFIGTLATSPGKQQTEETEIESLSTSPQRNYQRQSTIDCSTPQDITIPAFEEPSTVPRRIMWFDNVPAKLESINFVGGTGAGAGCVLVTMARNHPEEANIISNCAFTNCTGIAPLRASYKQMDHRYFGTTAGAVAIIYQSTHSRTAEFINNTFELNYGRGSGVVSGGVTLHYGEYGLPKLIKPNNNNNNNKHRSSKPGAVDPLDPEQESLASLRRELPLFASSTTPTDTEASSSSSTLTAQFSSSSPYSSTGKQPWRASCNLYNIDMSETLPFRLKGLFRRVPGILHSGRAIYTSSYAFPVRKPRTVAWIAFCDKEKFWGVSTTEEIVTHENVTFLLAPCRGRMRAGNNVFGSQNDTVSSEAVLGYPIIGNGAESSLEGLEFRHEGASIMNGVTATCEDVYHQCSTFSIFHGINAQSGRQGVYELQDHVHNGRPVFRRMISVDRTEQYVWYCASAREWIVTDDHPEAFDETQLGCRRGIASGATDASHPAAVRSWRFWDQDGWRDFSQRYGVTLRCLPPVEDRCQMLQSSSFMTPDAATTVFVLQPDKMWNRRAIYFSAPRMKYLWYCGTFEEWAISSEPPVEVNTSFFGDRSNTIDENNEHQQMETTTGGEKGGSWSSGSFSNERAKGGESYEDHIDRGSTYTYNEASSVPSIREQGEICNRSISSSNSFDFSPVDYIPWSYFQNEKWTTHTQLSNLRCVDDCSDFVLDIFSADERASGLYSVKEEPIPETSPSTRRSVSPHGVSSLTVLPLGRERTEGNTESTGGSKKENSGGGSSEGLPELEKEVPYAVLLSQQRRYQQVAEPFHIFQYDKFSLRWVLYKTVKESTFSSSKGYEQQTTSSSTDGKDANGGGPSAVVLMKAIAASESNALLRHPMAARAWYRATQLPSKPLYRWKPAHGDAFFPDDIIESHSKLRRSRTEYRYREFRVDKESFMTNMFCNFHRRCRMVNVTAGGGPSPLEELPLGLYVQTPYFQHQRPIFVQKHRRFDRAVARHLKSTTDEKAESSSSSSSSSTSSRDPIYVLYFCTKPLGWAVGKLTEMKQCSKKIFSQPSHAFWPSDVREYYTTSAAKHPLVVLCAAMPSTTSHLSLRSSTPATATPSTVTRKAAAMTTHTRAQVVLRPYTEIGEGIYNCHFKNNKAIGASSSDGITGAGIAVNYGFSTLSEGHLSFFLHNSFEGNEGEHILQIPSSAAGALAIYSQRKRGYAQYAVVKDTKLRNNYGPSGGLFFHQMDAAVHRLASTGNIATQSGGAVFVGYRSNVSVFRSSGVTNRACHGGGFAAVHNLGYFRCVKCELHRNTIGGGVGEAVQGGFLTVVESKILGVSENAIQGNSLSASSTEIRCGEGQGTAFLKGLGCIQALTGDGPLAKGRVGEANNNQRNLGGVGGGGGLWQQGSKQGGISGINNPAFSGKEIKVTDPDTGTGKVLVSGDSSSPLSQQQQQQKLTGTPLPTEAKARILFGLVEVPRWVQQYSVLTLIILIVLFVATSMRCYSFVKRKIFPTTSVTNNNNNNNGPNAQHHHREGNTGSGGKSGRNTGGGFRS